MGTVFAVVDESTDRKLALKQLGGAKDEEGGGGHHEIRFRSEFHTMARLHHPRIVEVFDYGVSEVGPYYTMELLDGHDLRDVAKSSPKDACRLLRDVAAALAFIHARRLLHRDLAPRNIRCTSDGRAKLIDFGVLATFGACEDICGTLPFISPENVRGIPLDHRADLFGFGALSYWLLTGRNAFAVRSVRELEESWKHRPAPPSSYSPEVPEALDRLVLSLLSVDPLARPSSAAEIIDRLTAIGELEPLDEEESTRGYLQSAAMVGRKDEMARIEKRMRRALKGRGRAITIEAPSGTGKSRFLQEVGLTAQVAGALVLRAQSTSIQRGPYGLMRELAHSLIAAAPEEALACAKKHASVVARVIPELKERLGHVVIAKPIGELTDDRIRVQEKIVAWFSEVAASRPLVLLVDDMQRCDEVSASVLASLAHQAQKLPLLLVAGLRTDERVRAPAAIAAIRDSGIPLRLRGLNESDVEDLVEALFGDIQHAARVAQWIHQAAGGSPLHCTELARHLVDKGVVQFLDGEWVVSPELEEEDLPGELAAAMDVRVRGLSENARALGETLSIYGGDFSLERCVLVAEIRDEEELLTALDDLVREEVIIGSSESYRFRHDGLREALLRRLDDERRQVLHAWVGEALASTEYESEEEAEIGWHLLRGGEELRGAKLLERAGRGLYEAQSFSDSIPPLEAALKVYEAAGHRPGVQLDIHHMLLMGGCMADRETAIRHTEASVDGFAYHSGLTIASKVSPFIGRHLALGVGVMLASLRWVLTSPFSRLRGPNPIEAMSNFFIAAGYSASVHALLGDLEATHAVVEKVEPVAVFQKRIPYGGYLMTRALYDSIIGHIPRVQTTMYQVLDIIRNDRITPVREVDRKIGEAAALIMLGTCSALDHEPELKDYTEKLGAMELRFADVASKQLLVVYHRLRGEEELARAAEEELEPMLIQMGSEWQISSSLEIFSSLAYAFTRDVMGLRRLIQVLARRTEVGIDRSDYLALARGEYHRERGELEEAEEVLREAAGTERYQVRVAVLAALAETLLARENFEEAMKVAQDCIDLSSAPKTLQFAYHMRAEAVFAQAMAHEGQVEEAAKRLDDAIKKSAHTGSPALCGGLHEARARVASLAGDRLSYELHRIEVGKLFKPTRNPTLLARIDELSDMPEIPADSVEEVAGAETMTVAGTKRSKTQDPDKTVDTVTVAGTNRSKSRQANKSEEPVTLMTRQLINESTELSMCSDRFDRSHRVLRLFIDATGARSGFLFLLQDGALKLMAPAIGSDPPSAVRKSASELMAAQGDKQTQMHEFEGTPWQSTLLMEPGQAAIGIVMVCEGVMKLAPPNGRLCATIVEMLIESGDV
jgi:tetratricopeptide (TPR) repeat protein